MINSKGEILIQKRAKMKKNFPGLWDMPSAGHVDIGETCIEAAIRETFEELGVKTKEEDYKYIGEYIYDVGWELAQIYLLRLDYEIEKFNLATEEVEEVKWLKYDAFKDIFYSEKFVLLDKDYKDMICKVLTE